MAGYASQRWLDFTWADGIAGEAVAAKVILVYLMQCILVHQNWQNKNTKSTILFIKYSPISKINMLFKTSRALKQKLAQHYEFALHLAGT